MHPWEHSNHLLLPYRGEAEDLLVLCEQLKLPMMTKLPRELRDAIGSFIGPSPLWRYSTVIQRAASLRLVPTPPTSITRLPLCDIQSWHRYGEPTVCEKPPTDSSHIRITVDSSGIKEISLLAHKEDDEMYKTAPTSSQLFIIEKPAVLGNVIARLQVVPQAYRDIIQASTRERALSLSQKATKIQPFSRLSFINTATCFGLTFLLHSDRIKAVHAHTSTVPTAYEAFLRLTSGCRESAVWFYLPLPIGEELTAVGGKATEHSNAPEPGGLFVGLVQLSKFDNGERSLQLVHCTRRPILVHDATAGQISLFAPEPAATTRMPWTQDSLPLGGEYTTQAPLEGVTAAHAFMDRETNHCGGILLQYQDGKKVSVGQCRLGLDKVQSVRHPVRICCATVNHILSVEFTGEETHSHTNKGGANWTCHKMTGSLHFRFNHVNAEVVIVN
ncbi:hypothetical protein A9K55_003710 [Cordyceps militaris]|uniref:Uncharacterized protein n=1 Tax=Cordyceps militaris TaxID=73501 RepID=A0A2H4S8R8_CORMI|nr:hypothetical protein A9K55_003710 [Cordyceps militaris]